MPVQASSTVIRFILARQVQVLAVALGVVLERPTMGTVVVQTEFVAAKVH